MNTQFRRLSLTRLPQRGDTIVEVMISLIVISSILTSAFIVSRTSSRGIQGSQEHSAASQLLQGQIEMLRSYAMTGTPPPTLPIGTFCMKALASGALQAATSGCTVPSGDYVYTLSIQLETAATVNQGPTYNFKIQWPALGGGTNQESMVYRLPS